MNSVMYKVVFEGDLLPGYEQAAVQKQLAELFHIEVAMAGRLFIGTQLEIKKYISFDQAKEYVREMSKLGALAFMLPHEEDDTVVPEYFENKVPENTGSSKARAFENYFENKAAKKEDDTIEVPRFIDTGSLGQGGWGEVSGESKVREIEMISRKILQQHRKS